MRIKKFIALLLVVLSLFSLCACGKELSYDSAIKEVNSFYKSIDPEIKSSTVDMNYEVKSVSDSLANIDTFPLVVTSTASITIEIAAPSEIAESNSKTDNWLIEAAEKFNKSGYTVSGQSVGISIRKISSGEVVTYMTEGGYTPDVYIPSNNALGKMLNASGIETITLNDKLLGNTAGILISNKAMAKFENNEVTLHGVLEKALTGDLVFAYTNPYTSATGLNALASMLQDFDSENPLSEKATSKLIEYQKNAPDASYNTAELVQKAEKGIIDAMVMEEQAYTNSSNLLDYSFIPFGIRHDHPVYTFNYVSSEKQEVARLFTDFCCTDEIQKLGTDKGFNKHGDYVCNNKELSGQEYKDIQKVWKLNKSEGRPTVAVFVADTSGSMDGTRLQSLKDSLLNTMQYINEDCYIGLVTYNSEVYIDMANATNEDKENAKLDLFDAKHKAIFSGAVKNLQASGGTSTYDGVLVGLKLLYNTSKEVPNANLKLIVLSDGEQNSGASLDRVTPILKALKVPVYTIGYELEDGEESLKTLSAINEATFINANTDDIVNKIRNLFQSSL